MSLQQRFKQRLENIYFIFQLLLITQDKWVTSDIK